MARATDEQVQQFVDQRIRPRAEQARLLLLAMQDDVALIDDVYEALATDPTWTDARTDGPPHLLTASDVLAIHSFATAMIAAMNGHAQLPVVREACVRNIG
jgi:hypothetical protein